MKELDRFPSEAAAIDYLIQIGKATNRTGARKYLKARVPLEPKYQEKIMKYLKKRYPKAYIWKAAAGPYSRGGVPDIIALIDGRFYGFEVKRPYYGKPSDLQKQAIKAIRANGGYAGTVCFPEEVEQIIVGSRNRKAGERDENKDNNNSG